MAFLSTYQFDNLNIGRIVIFIDICVYSMSTSLITIHYLYRYFAICKYEIKIIPIIPNFRVEKLRWFSKIQHAIMWLLVCIFFSTLWGGFANYVMYPDRIVGFFFKVAKNTILDLRNCRSKV